MREASTRLSDRCNWRFPFILFLLRGSGQLRRRFSEKPLFVTIFHAPLKTLIHLSSLLANFLIEEYAGPAGPRGRPQSITASETLSNSAPQQMARCNLKLLLPGMSVLPQKCPSSYLVMAVLIAVGVPQAHSQPASAAVAASSSIAPSSSIEKAKPWISLALQE